MFICIESEGMYKLHTNRNSYVTYFGSVSIRYLYMSRYTVIIDIRLRPVLLSLYNWPPNWRNAVNFFEV